MESGWERRLIEAIDADGRSYNRLSEDAGLGRNYVQQMVRNHKAPSVDKMAKLLDMLGERWAFYVLTGVHAGPDDVELLRILARLPRAARQNALRMFQSILENEESQDNESAVRASSGTTG